MKNEGEVNHIKTLIFLNKCFYNLISIKQNVYKRTGAQSGTWTRKLESRGFWDLRVYHSTIWAQILPIYFLTPCTPLMSRTAFAGARIRGYGSRILSRFTVSVRTAHLPFRHLGVWGDSIRKVNEVKTRICFWLGWFPSTFFIFLYTTDK